MTSTVHFSILYGACFLEYFSLSPNCTGIRRRSSWKLYSKFASCFRTRLSAFHIRILNIHTFTHWEFLSRHVTNRNNHNNYTTALMSNNNHNQEMLTSPLCKCTSMRMTKLLGNWTEKQSECLGAAAVWSPDRRLACQPRPWVTAVWGRA